VLAANTFSWWPFAAQKSHSSTVVNNEPHQEKSKSTNNTKVKSPSNQTPKQYDTPEDSNQSDSTLNGTINYSNVVDDTLSVRATINQKLSSGSCQLTLKNQTTGQTVVKSANIIANPSSSTCSGFDIPVSQVGSGNWSIVIDLTSSNESGQITGSVKI